LKKDADQLPPDESLLNKVLQAYLRMNLKAGRRKKRQKRGQHEWKPQVGDWFSTDADLFLKPQRE
jgi:hypothetical protein